MSAVNDGGPAFPIPIAGCNDGCVYNTLEQSSGELGGMTLRDYFAAKALVGALANSDSGNGAMEPTMMYVGSHPEEACELLATFAYRLADAMLAARVRGEQA